MKLKIGDEVRVLKMYAPREQRPAPKLKGKTGTVIEVGNFWIGVQFDVGQWWFLKEGYLEKVKPKKEKA